MPEIVICDTNAVIQLAIICPEVFTSSSEELKLVIHFSVRQEIIELRKNASKENRLGKVFDKILDTFPISSAYQLPSRSREERIDKRLKRLEAALPPEKKTAGSSKKDRQFLILAYEHKLSLLTNDLTPLSLAESFLGEERTWTLSKLLKKLIQLEVVTNEQIAKGVSDLQKYGERLRRDCQKAVDELLQDCGG